MFIPHLTCDGCGIRGHILDQCPVATDEAGTAIPRPPGKRRNKSKKKGGPGPWIIRDLGGGPVEGAGTAEAEGNENEATGQEVSTRKCNGILFNQHSDAHINPNWVLLDSESTDHIFCNKSF